MSDYALANGLHYCLANDKVVLLDLNADRYFGLPAQAEDAFRRWASGDSLTESEVSALSPLTEKGYLVAATAPVSRPPLHHTIRPSRDLSDVAGSRVRAAALASALAFQAGAFLDLRTRRLGAIVRQLRECKPRPSLRSDQVPVDLAGAFLKTRGWVESEQKCLRWSLAMVRFLGHHGFQADLVVGVRGAPFMAHAWVQCAEVVLSDTLDNVMAYTPILVV